MSKTTKTQSPKPKNPKPKTFSITQSKLNPNHYQIRTGRILCSSSPLSRVFRHLSTLIPRTPSTPSKITVLVEYPAITKATKPQTKPTSQTKAWTPSPKGSVHIKARSSEPKKRSTRPRR